MDRVSIRALREREKRFTHVKAGAIMNSSPTIGQLLLQPSSLAGYAVAATAVSSIVSSPPTNAYGWFMAIVGILGSVAAIFKNDGSHNA